MSSILVRWGPVPKEGRFGIIIGYNVSYAKHEEPSDWSNAPCFNTSWCEIKGLDFGTGYYINVTGYTVKGFGPSAQAEGKTDKGGKFFTNNNRPELSMLCSH